MNKLTNVFDKKSENDRCYCSSNTGLFVPNRQLSLIVASLLFSFFGCFIAGYFFGKRSQIEEFTQKIAENSFSDRIHSSLISMDNADERETVVTKTNNQSFNGVEDVCMTDVISQLSVTNNAKPIDKELQKQFYAELIGFVTEKAAQRFSQKLALKNIETIVKTRVSKTAKGQTHYWYQVITPVYSDKEALRSLVHRLAKEERLNENDINIKSC